jgi:pyruvate dehydrogenase E2 component (dihydrolipoamide acetyltransferase)
MAQQFRFPDVGEGITEGEIVRWLVKEGDEVKADQTIAEIETDKAVVEMPSPYSGTVLKLHFKEKDIVKVGDVLITIGRKGESAEAAAAPPAPSAPGPAAKPPAAAPAGQVTVQATPRVRKLAEELGVDLAAISGTGPQGRVTEADVRAAKAAPPPKLAVKVKAKYDFYGDIERVPLRGIRRATARRMTQSVHTAAHVTHFDEADAGVLARLLESLKPEAEAKKVKLTYLALILKAVVAALKSHPMLNSSLSDEDEEIIVKKYYNIGIAVDVPDGLIVPVVKGPDLKSIWDVARDIHDLAVAARSRSLDLADLKGGTFSITNVGMLGGEWATPIINYPEVAILATLKIADRVRAEDGRVVVKKTLPLCLSIDHRVVDGAEAARFTNDLKKTLEDEVALSAAVGAGG